MNKTTPYYAAFLRALVVGALAGVSTFLATWATTDDAKAIGIAAATAFLAPFLARFGGEGTYDTNRDARVIKGVSKLNRTDVGSTVMPADAVPGAVDRTPPSPDAPPAPAPLPAG
ncbi:MAG TPA: hypothetical protein VKD67_09330 [Acidimicrobiales bacterium]|jgi:hypothetical protein|nr:hypothetical protein [Acidimicrobiales bacterium]